MCQVAQAYMNKAMYNNNPKGLQMESNILAELVAQVVASGNTQTLSEDKRRTFHREFESEISDEVEQMRAQKRRAYEEAKQIAIR